MKLEFLFEDESVVAANKPAGLLSIQDRHDSEIPNLAEELRITFGEIFVVHRLDRGTSGVILFAKNPSAHRALNLQFESHTAVKKYIAVIEGIMRESHGTISLPLALDARRPGTMHVDESNGKESLTEFTVIHSFKRFSAIEITLHTGRQHQIRVHFAATGHPVVCDGVYGKSETFLLSSIKRKFKSAGTEKPLIARTALHASELTFYHPVANERITVTAPIPHDIATLLKQLEKWDR